MAAYHLQTEAEKGKTLAGVDGLPDHYRAEILAPRTAFANAVVLVALSGNAAAGCLVVTTAAVAGRSEVKRLWTDPALRGRGIASGLVRAALTHCGEGGIGTVRLSVWKWRADAIALYERLASPSPNHGTSAISWCMERDVSR